MTNIRLEKGRDALEALARANPQGTVLVVEDDEPIQKLLRVVLQRAGSQVVLARDGHAALARLAEAVPDLLVSDVKMPGLNGLELLTTLRADPLTRAIPLILLTARNRPEDLVEGFGLGAD